MKVSLIPFWGYILIFFTLYLQTDLAPVNKE